MNQAAKRPTGIELHKRSATLELRYSDEEKYHLPAEYLRVFSPSAEVRGHGRDDGVLQTGKIDVKITGIIPVGHYAIQLVFDDGHDSGLYAWEYLYALCINQKSNWQDYLQSLHEAGATRDPAAQVVRLGN